MGNLVQLTKDICASLTNKLREKVIPLEIETRHTDFKAGFKKRTRLGFRYPIFLIDVNPNGDLRINPLRRKYDEIIKGISEEFNLDYSNTHNMRGDFYAEKLF